MTIQIIKVPGGEELVVLPKREYEELIRAAEEAREDAADSAAYSAAMADPHATEPMPSEVMDHMRQGAGLLKALRLWRGLLQAELARKAKLSQGFLSDLENRRRKRTPAVARKLAKALNVPEHWLV